ncbi:MAG: hypothetical protein RIQ89_1859 [Bacteroidota bacterium]
MRKFYLNFFRINCILCLIFSFPLAGQIVEVPDSSNTGSVKGWEVSSIQVSTGSASLGESYFNFRKFQKLAPNSFLLNQSYPGYLESNFNIGSDRASVFSFSVTLNKLRSNRNDIKFSAGFNYFPNISYSSNLSKSTSFPFDTLISTQTGNAIYFDSIFTSSCVAEYNYDHLRADLNFFFESKSKTRWTLYGGLGLSIGLSLKNYITVNFNEWSQIEPRDNSYNYYIPYQQNYSGLSFGNEVFENRTNASAATYLLGGVRFNVSKRNLFWSKVAFFYEIRPSLNYFYFPKLNAYLRAGFMNQLGVHIRMR